MNVDDDCSTESPIYLGPNATEPMMTATNIHYELADRVQGLSAGGIGAILLLAQKIGLIKEIDRNLHLLKVHLPYHESDHVLNIAFNILAGGKRIEHLELRRNDEVYLNALGAQRIPDPTTAGDFCRRFRESDVMTLMDAINQARLRVWAQQPPEFFEEAILDADGTIVPTDAECKQGVDFAYDGLGLPSALDLAGQYRRTTVPVQSQRQPPLAGAGRRVLRQGCHALPSGRLPQDPAAGRHQIRSDQASGSLGRRGQHPLHLRVRGPRHPQGQSRRASGRRVQLSGTTAAIPDQDCPPPTARAGQTGDRPRARLQDDPPARGDGRRVRLSARRLQEELSHDRRSASGWGSTRGRCGCSRNIATSFTSPTTAR